MKCLLKNLVLSMIHLTMITVAPSSELSSRDDPANNQLYLNIGDTEKRARSGLWEAIDRLCKQTYAELDIKIVKHWQGFLVNARQNSYTESRCISFKEAPILYTQIGKNWAHRKQILIAWLLTEQEENTEKRQALIRLIADNPPSNLQYPSIQGDGSTTEESVVGQVGLSPEGIYAEADATSDQREIDNEVPSPNQERELLNKYPSLLLPVSNPERKLRNHLFSRVANSGNVNIINQGGVFTANGLNLSKARPRVHELLLGASEDDRVEIVIAWLLASSCGTATQRNQIFQILLIARNPASNLQYPSIQGYGSPIEESGPSSQGATCANGATGSQAAQVHKPGAYEGGAEVNPNLEPGNVNPKVDEFDPWDDQSPIFTALRKALAAEENLLL